MGESDGGPWVLFYFQLVYGFALIFLCTLASFAFVTGRYRRVLATGVLMVAVYLVHWWAFANAGEPRG